MTLDWFPRNHERSWYSLINLGKKSYSSKMECRSLSSSKSSASWATNKEKFDLNELVFVLTKFAKKARNEVLSQWMEREGDWYKTGYQFSCSVTWWSFYYFLPYSATVFVLAFYQKMSPKIKGHTMLLAHNASPARNSWKRWGLTICKSSKGSCHNIPPRKERCSKSKPSCCLDSLFRYTFLAKSSLRLTKRAKKRYNFLRENWTLGQVQSNPRKNCPSLTMPRKSAKPFCFA